MVRKDTLLHREVSPELRRNEHIPTFIYEDSNSASRFVAETIANLIREKAAQGQQAVLGLATGSTPDHIQPR